MNMLKRSWLAVFLPFLCCFAHGMDDVNLDKLAIPVHFVEQHAPTLIDENLDEPYNLNGVQYVKCFHKMQDYYGNDGNDLVVKHFFYPMSPKINYVVCFYQVFEIIDYRAHIHHTIALGIPQEYKKEVKNSVGVAEYLN